MWAGAPFVWQFYRWATARITPNSEAFLEPLPRPSCHEFWRAWNGLAPCPNYPISCPGAKRFSRMAFR